MTKLSIGCALMFLVVGLTGCGTAPPVIWPEANLEGSEAQPLRIGAAAVTITPTRPLYMAGGIPYRLPVRVHDDLWARAVVIDNGRQRVALVALDLIGLFYDDVVRIRTDVARKTAVNYLLVSATHTHNGPDVLGAWSPSPICLDSSYRQYIGTKVAEAVARAADNLRPALLRVARGDSGADPLTRDTRPPLLIDDTLTVWQAVDVQSEEVIATSIHYASHPITIPTLNFDVSSDFVHTLRAAIESGFDAPEGSVQAQGGLCLFFNGALGGRITPRRDQPLTDGPSVDPAHAKAQAYGYRLARRAQQLLAQESQQYDGPLALSATSRQIQVAIDNPLLGMGISLCMLNRSIADGQVNSEVARVCVGPLEFLAVPGMIFPELVLGTVERMESADFPNAPLESPALLDVTSQPYPVVIGLANDMLGYLIPKCLWDEHAPFTSTDGTAPYGEVISAGPNAAAAVIEAFAELPGP